MIARYALHTGQSENQRAIARDVFDSESATAVSDLPSHLKSFRQRVNQVWSVKTTEIIKGYTLAPVYLPFLQLEKAKQVIKSMCSEQGGNIHTRCGIPASLVQQPIFFRYCPTCAQEQYERLGEPYWQRSHQLSAIDICYRHKHRLVSSALHFHPKEKHLYRTAAEECFDKPAQSEGLTDIENRLLCHFQSLLALQKVTGYSAHQWSMFYQNMATKLGFKQGCRVDHLSIRQQMENDWSLTRFKDYLEPASDNDWLVNLFRKHRKTFHPLRHLMVCASLAPNMSMKNIFSTVGRLPIKAAIFVEAARAKSIKSDDLIQKKHQEWLSLCRASNGAGTKAIRAERPGGALYTWLYRYDRHWLMKNKPTRAIQKAKQHTVDYERWDSENLQALAQFVQSRAGESGRPRLSRTFLVKQLPRYNSVEKHLQDLPKTDKWLNNNAESIEDYQLFRIQAALETLKSQNLPIKRWRLLRIAGIRFQLVASKVEEAISRLEVIG